MTSAPTPRIAFAIPYYSGLDYLAATLTSIRAQTITDWEAVVVDDAGPEAAAALVASLNEPRIRYVRNPTNLGLAGNWNAAIAQTTAPLVSLLHADDELMPGYGDAMASLLERHPAALAGHCRVELIDDKGRSTRTLADSVKTLIRPRGTSDIVTAGDDGLNSLLRGFWIFCPTLCYRREFLDQVSQFEARWRFVVDFSFIARALFAGQHVVGTQEVHYRYRRHSANQTAVLTSELTRFEEELGLYREVAMLAKERGWSRSAHSARIALIVRAHLVVSAMKSLIRGDLKRCKNAIVLALSQLASLQ